MDELSSAGKTGFYVRTSGTLKAAARRYKVNVGATARNAVAAAVREAAGREALAKRKQQG